METSNRLRVVLWDYEYNRDEGEERQEHGFHRCKLAVVAAQGGGLRQSPADSSCGTWYHQRQRQLFVTTSGAVVSGLLENRSVYRPGFCMGGSNHGETSPVVKRAVWLRKTGQSLSYLFHRFR